MQKNQNCCMSCILVHRLTILEENCFKILEYYHFFRNSGNHFRYFGSKLSKLLSTCPEEQFESNSFFWPKGFLILDVFSFSNTLLEKPSGNFLKVFGHSAKIFRKCLQNFTLLVHIDILGEKFFCKSFRFVILFWLELKDTEELWKTLSIWISEVRSIFSGRISAEKSKAIFDKSFFPQFRRWNLIFRGRKF